ncbi:hypothetical protein QOT17_008203 [Balamuthia mandrillaris]
MLGDVSPLQETTKDQDELPSCIRHLLGRMPVSFVLSEVDEGRYHPHLVLRLCNRAFTVSDCCPNTLRERFFGVQSRRVEVQLAENLQSGELVVLKIRRDGKVSKQEQEHDALQALRGCEGIVQLYGETECGSLVLEYLDHSVPPNDPSVTMFRAYFYQLLKVYPLSIILCSEFPPAGAVGM